MQKGGGGCNAVAALVVAAGGGVGWDSGEAYMIFIFCGLLSCAHDLV